MDVDSFAYIITRDKEALRNPQGGAAAGATSRVYSQTRSLSHPSAAPLLALLRCNKSTAAASRTVPNVQPPATLKQLIQALLAVARPVASPSTKQPSPQPSRTKQTSPHMSRAKPKKLRRCMTSSAYLRVPRACRSRDYRPILTAAPPIGNGLHSGSVTPTVCCRASYDDRADVNTGRSFPFVLVITDC